MNALHLKETLCVAMVILSVIFAGCAGQDTQPSSTTTGTTIETERQITVEGAPFPVDATTVFHRIEAMLGENLTPPEVRVLKVNRDGEKENVSTDLFSRRMGITQRRSLAQVGGNTHEGVVRIFYTENSTSKQMEQVLAHEYVHVSQPSRLKRRMATKQGPHADTTDTRIVREAITEGSAVYVANRYTEQYLADTAKQASHWDRKSFDAGTRWHFAPYYFGSRYVRNRIDNPSALPTLYNHPPNTTEQLLHGYDPTKEPPRDLSVNVRTGASKWKVKGSDRKGELFVRTILAEQLPTSRAATAATGWGNDRVVTLQATNQTLHAWTVRWDNGQNASQFEAAAEAYLDDRSANRSTVWTDGNLRFSVHRVDSTTVVVLVGNTSVRSVNVTTNDGVVVVRTDKTESTSER